MNQVPSTNDRCRRCQKCKPYLHGFCQYCWRSLPEKLKWQAKAGTLEAAQVPAVIAVCAGCGKHSRAYRGGLCRGCYYRQAPAVRGAVQAPPVERLEGPTIRRLFRGRVLEIQVGIRIEE
ncbi:hypothetical protein [Candidatus Nitrospira bockiana]